MFDDYIRFQAAMRGDAPAIVTKAGIASFGRFEADVRRAVQALRTVDCGPDEAVSVAVESPYLEWVLILALARRAIASGPSGDTGSRWTITDDGKRGRATDILLTPEQLETIQHGPEQPHLRIRSDPDSLGHVFRTSGTTGDPKRVGISWRAIEANVDHAIASHADVPGLWCIATGIHTTLGFYWALAAWRLGNPVTAGLGAAATVIARLKPRLLGAVPAQLELILDTLPRGHAPWPMRIVSGGTSMPAALAKRIREQLTGDVILNYGSTEVSQMATATLAMLEREPRAVGYPRPQVEVRIIDEDGSEVAAGETGRLCFRTGRLSTGYLDDAAMTAECYRDGWFHSRDLGRFCADGLLVLEGRVDEVMNLGGHKILPASLEEVALACSGVREAAAVAFRTTSGLDRCALVVVADDPFDSAELRVMLEGRVMRSQRLHIMRLDSLPRNARGKIERQKLRERAEIDAAEPTA